MLSLKRKSLDLAGWNINPKPVIRNPNRGIPVMHHNITQQCPRLIDNLPVEILDHIQYHLPLPDVGALRLSCSAIAKKLCRTRYVHHFRNKSIDLSQTALQRFLQMMTDKSGVGCLLENCTIVGIAQLSVVPAQETAQLQELLTHCFSNLTQHLPDKCLASLTLQIKAGEYNQNGQFIESEAFYSSQAIWEAARRTFITVMAALHAAKLAVVHRFSVFMGEKGCSLAYSEFINFDTYVASNISFQPFQSLKRFEASFSVLNTSSGVEQLEAFVRHPTNILHDIAQAISKAMPTLEILHLHWYALGKVQVPFAAQEVSSPIESSYSLKCLRECILRGFYIIETDLLGFLTAVQPEALSLAYVSMIVGDWSRILQYITNPYTSTTWFHLDDIFHKAFPLVSKGPGLVHFNGPGAPKFQYRVREIWPSTLSSHDVTDAIEYRIPSGGALRSLQKNRWRRGNRAEYGPWNGRYDFIAQNSEDFSRQAD